jgi:hypothetical protein
MFVHPFTYALTIPKLLRRNNSYFKNYVLFVISFNLIIFSLISSFLLINRSILIFLHVFIYTKSDIFLVIYVQISAI